MSGSDFIVAASLFARYSKPSINIEIHITNSFVNMNLYIYIWRERDNEKMLAFSSLALNNI